MSRYTCPTWGCEVHWHSTDEPGLHCSMCLHDLVPIDPAVDMWWLERHERGEGPPPPRSCRWPMIDVAAQAEAVARAYAAQGRLACYVWPWERLAAYFATRPRHALEIVRPGSPACVDVETLRARGLRVLRLPFGRAITYGSIGPL